MNQVDRQRAGRKRLFKRKLTPFLCEEMLYDYFQGYLDPETESDIEAFLKENPTSQQELQKIEAAIQYCRQVRALDVRAEMLEQIQSSTSFWQPLYYVFQFKKWPEPLRFSVEGLLIAAAALLIMTYVPWGTIKQKWFQDRAIWVVSPPPESKSTTINPAAMPAPKEDPSVATADGPESPALIAATDSEKKAESKKPAPKSGETVVASPGSAADVKSTTVAAVPSDTTTANVSSTASTGAAPMRPQPVRSEPAGFVYRIYMDLPNLDRLSPRIAERIQALGGEKAGEVPLGWRRDKGSYFHFTVPEAQYDAVIGTLKEYGEARVSKDPHRRVMPEGVVRMILWIEELPGTSVPATGTAGEPPEESEGLNTAPEESESDDVIEGPDVDISPSASEGPDEDLVNDTDGL